MSGATAVSGHQYTANQASVIQATKACKTDLWRCQGRPIDAQGYPPDYKGGLSVCQAELLQCKNEQDSNLSDIYLNYPTEPNGATVVSRGQHTAVQASGTEAKEGCKEGIWCFVKNIRSILKAHPHLTTELSQPVKLTCSNAITDETQTGYTSTWTGHQNPTIVPMNLG